MTRIRARGRRAKRRNDLESPCNRVTPPAGLLYVGWTEPGEWFNLSVETTESGAYVADVLYTSNRRHRRERSASRKGLSAHDDV